MKNKLYFVIGKGGVGKTTISIRLAKHLASEGLNTLIVECNGAQQVSSYFNQHSTGYITQRLDDNISTLSISPLEAIEDYIGKHLKFKSFFKIIFQNKLTSPLIEGLPGLHDAIQLGKIYDLAIEQSNNYYVWDAIIIDCPATGHGLSLLNSARTMMNVTKAGPLFENNKLVDRLMKERSEVVLVTTPEELPCLESKELWMKMRSDYRAKIKILFVNKFTELPPQLSPQKVLFPQRYSTIFSKHFCYLHQRQHLDSVQLRWLNWLNNQFDLTVSTIPFSFNLAEPFTPKNIFEWKKRHD